MSTPQGKTPPDWQDATYSVLVELAALGMLESMEDARLCPPMGKEYETVFTVRIVDGVAEMKKAAFKVIES